MKKATAILLLLMTFMVSCESDSTSVTNPPTVLLKKRIKTTNGNSITETFTYDGDKIVSIETSTGLLKRFVYTGELITKVIYTYVGGSLETTLGETFEYNGADQLIKKTSVTYAPGASGPTTYYIDYIHNNDGTISYTKYQNGTTSTADSGIIHIDTNQVAEISNVYYASGWGFVSHGGAVIYYSGGTKTKSAIYENDNQRNPLGNIVGFKKILFAGVLDFKGAADHNVTKIRTFTTSIVDDYPTNSYNKSETLTITRQYDTLGYPTYFSQTDSQYTSQIYEETYLYE